MKAPNPNIIREKNKTLKQFEASMWEKHAFCYIGVVTELRDKKVEVKLFPSVAPRDFDVRNGMTRIETTNKKVECLRVQGLSLLVGDVVVVIFTDYDTRPAVKEIGNGRSTSTNFNVSEPVYHDFNFGIVINKVII